ncbi:MAG: class I lanthipeptide [Deltaproteobacteria bacterium]|nr:class I lanthipeptide [Deltaproteobacteria bacterium]
MKKNDKRSLTLRTETISNLSTDKLRSVNGGWTTIVIQPTTGGWTTILSSTVSGGSGITTAGTGG